MRYHDIQISLQKLIHSKIEKKSVISLFRSRDHTAENRRNDPLISFRWLLVNLTTEIRQHAVKFPCVSNLSVTTFANTQRRPLRSRPAASKAGRYHHVQSSVDRATCEPYAVEANVCSRRTNIGNVRNGRASAHALQRNGRMCGGSATIGTVLDLAQALRTVPIPTLLGLRSAYAVLVW